MMVRGIQLRRVSFEDCGQMADLMNRNYARQRPKEYFRWQYFDYPRPVVCFGAFRQERLVGMFGLQRKPLSGGGQIDQVIDIVIDAEHRALGLFQALWQQATAAIGGDAPQMVLANASGKEACVRRLGYTIVTQIDSLRLLPGSASRSGDNLRPGEGTAEPPHFRLAMDAELLEWRFTRHPIFRYHKFRGPDDSLIVGKVYGEGSDGQGDLVFFHARPAAPEWVRACDALFLEGVGQVNCWALAGTPERSDLLALGFQPEVQERFLCVLGLPELANAAQWAIVQADTEHF